MQPFYSEPGAPGLPHCDALHKHHSALSSRINRAMQGFSRGCESAGEWAQAREWPALHDGDYVCYFSGGVDRLTAQAVGEIEQIHARWIGFEIAGEDHRLIELCADEIELWPPDAPPVRGRSAVSEYLSQGTSKIQRVETAERRIHGSNEIAYLTANYETTFSTMDNPAPKRASGSHLWILRKQADRWLVALVSWSTWNRAATS